MTGRPGRLPAGVVGEVRPGFEPVAVALAAALGLQTGSGGIQVAARHRGDWVVDLAAGSVERWSLIHTWSAVKPLAGACVLALVARGAVGLDQPVRELWPELRAGADGRLLVRHVLTHAAGLSAVPPPGTLDLLLDWDVTVAGLEAAQPEWAPGEAVGEHAMTYGHLVGELVRRADGRTLGRFLAEELSGPLGLDVHVGVTDADLSRCVDLGGMTQAWWDGRRDPAAGGWAGVVPTGDPELVNTEAWRRAEIPAVNGQATARGLASFWAALLDDRLPAGVGRPGASGVDRVIGQPVTWTLAGGQIDGADVGMGGLGGQWACARPADDLAWCLLTTECGEFDRVDTVEPALLACCAAA